MNTRAYWQRTDEPGIAAVLVLETDTQRVEYRGKNMSMFGVVRWQKGIRFTRQQMEARAAVGEWLPGWDWRKAQ